MFDLVAGGAGFIGSHLVDRLIAEGRRVRVLDNFSVGRRGNLQQLDGNPRLEVVEADIADMRAVDVACAGAERIFHPHVQATGRSWRSRHLAAESRRSMSLMPLAETFIA